VGRVRVREYFFGTVPGLNGFRNGRISERRSSAFLQPFLTRKIVFQQGVPLSAKGKEIHDW
jgi:hypothetical protein